MKYKHFDSRKLSTTFYYSRSRTPNIIIFSCIFEPEVLKNINLKSNQFIVLKIYIFSAVRTYCNFSLLSYLLFITTNITILQLLIHLNKGANTHIQTLYKKTFFWIQETLKRKDQWKFHHLIFSWKQKELHLLDIETSISSIMEKIIKRNKSVT